MVGSITFSKQPGDHVKKGDEVQSTSFFFGWCSAVGFDHYLMVSFLNDVDYAYSLVISHLVEVLLFACLKRLAPSSLHVSFILTPSFCSFHIHQGVINI